MLISIEVHQGAADLLACLKFKLKLIFLASKLIELLSILIQLILGGENVHADQAVLNTRFELLVHFFTKYNLS